jgi:hypothetical protein
MSVPAVAVKVPLFAPAPIVRLTGTVRASAVLVRLMDAAAVAALVKAMVQVALCPLPRVSGVQVSVDN